MCDIDKADYYKRAIDKERAAREQSDKQVIDLLKDIKTRYESKISAYKQKAPSNPAPKATTMTTKAADDDWGSGNTGGQANDNWGQDNNDTQADQGSWDNNDTQANQGSWGNDDTGGKANDTWCQADQPANEGWGDQATTKQEESSKPDTPVEKQTDTKAADDNWGSGDAGWGTQADNKQEASSNPDTSKEATKTTKATSDDWGADDTTSTKKTEAKQDPKQNQKKKANQKANKNQKTSTAPSVETVSAVKPTTTDKPTPTVKATPAAKPTSTVEPASTVDTTPNVVDTKQQSEIKSQLLSAKLDIRLLERENATLKEERDGLASKLKNVNAEQDTLKMKVRSLTVDLVSANEEIHKLNERIDELEAEKRTREKDNNFSESKRKSMENRFKQYQIQIAELQSENSLLREDKHDNQRRIENLSRRNERLENDLAHSKNLIRTLKDGCALVEDQARTFEIRHDTVVMSKSDMERELIAIKEEATRHISTINKLQKSNEYLTAAFTESSEENLRKRHQIEEMHQEFTRRINDLEVQNLKLSQTNSQLQKVLAQIKKIR